MQDTTLGRYTEISERCRVSESALGDYSYMMQDCGVWCVDHRQVRQHRRCRRASMPPTTRPGGRRCTTSPTAPRTIGTTPSTKRNSSTCAAPSASRSATTPGSATARRCCRASLSATALRSALVRSCRRMSRPTPSSPACPAKPIRERFDRKTAERYQALAWWDWDHAQLRAALDDFRHLSAEAFLEKHGG